MIDSKCKICRRVGEKLFLKGERCLTPKCPMVRRPSPPGLKGKRRKSPLSEYGRQLREKQKLKNWYNLTEKQFKNYVKEILEKSRTQDAAKLLIQRLESRFDNVIFRLGWAISRSQAKQLISHKHFLINEKSVNIPSFQLKRGDKISIKKNSLKKAIFQNLPLTLKKYQPPSWLQLDKEKLTATVKEFPSLEEAAPPAEISAIFEFYSR